MKTNTQILLLGVMTAWFALLGVARADTTNVWTDNFESASPWDNWSVDNGVWEIGGPATLAGQPSGKTLKIYIIAANDAGQAAPSDTVQIVVP